MFHSANANSAKADTCSTQIVASCAHLFVIELTDCNGELRLLYVKKRYELARRR